MDMYVGPKLNRSYQGEKSRNHFGFVLKFVEIMNMKLSSKA